MNKKKLLLAAMMSGLLTATAYAQTEGADQPPQGESKAETKKDKSHKDKSSKNKTHKQNKGKAVGKDKKDPNSCGGAGGEQHK